jgi:phospholipid transport system substrate-binding protein
MLTQNFTAAPDAVGLDRRLLLRFTMAAAAGLVLSSRASAQVDTSGASTCVQRFNEALIGVMKAGKQTTFHARFGQLAPAVDQTFDLPAILAVSVGPRWVSITPDQQNRLLEAFRRYTIASYVANFDSYEAQTFSVSQDIREVGANRVIVSTYILPVSGDTRQLGYIVKQTSAGWKIVDVLADGSISRVAVQRSDFRGVLASGGGEALVERLQRKTSDLSNGSIADRAAT